MPPQASAGTGEDTDTMVSEGEPQTAPIRTLLVSEALVQKYGPTLVCERCHWCNAVNQSYDAALTALSTEPSAR